MVFEVLSSDTDEFPDINLIDEVTVLYQAFVFNAYGYLDNLAHIWISEQNVTQENGNPLHPTPVGLVAKSRRI